jgi:hypothetical protein
MDPGNSDPERGYWLKERSDEASYPSSPRILQATEQIQNQNDYKNGSDYAVRPVAESITACRESSD